MTILILLTSVFGIMLVSIFGFAIIAIIMNEYYDKKEGNP